MLQLVYKECKVGKLGLAYKGLPHCVDADSGEEQGDQDLPHTQQEQGMVPGPGFTIMTSWPRLKTPLPIFEVFPLSLGYVVEQA